VPVPNKDDSADGDVLKEQLSASKSNEVSNGAYPSNEAYPSVFAPIREMLSNFDGL
jgi:hypothetical protein